MIDDEKTDALPPALDEAVTNLGRSVASIVRKTGRKRAASTIDRATSHVAAGARFLGSILRIAEGFVDEVRK